MANCIQCNSYFRRNRFNQSDSCEECLDSVFTEDWDEDDEVDILRIVNPSGKTKAYIEDD